MTVADSNRRYQATGLSSTTITVVGWTPVEDTTTLKAWVNATPAYVLSVSGQDVTIDLLPSPSDVVTIISDQPQERTGSYAPGNYSQYALNYDWDKGVELTQETQERADRSLKFPAYDPNGFDATLPAKADRVGRVLGFNATTGDPEAGPELADVSTLAAITADIATLADIEDGTDATDAIQTVAGISSDVPTVAGISSNVTTVAGISANVTTVAGISGNVTTVAGVASDVPTVAGVSTDVTTVAGVASDVTSVAGVAANVTTVAGVSADVTTVAGISSDVTTVATNDANVTTVAGVSSDVTTVAGISSDVTAVAGDSADIGTVATNIANVNTVATNIVDVNSFADTYFVSASAPGSPTAGDLWYDTSASVLKSYNGSTWGALAVPASIDDLSDVDTSTVAPTDGQVLMWDNAASKWEPGNAGGSAFTYVGSYQVQTSGQANAFTTSPLNSTITGGWFSTYSELKFRITAKIVGPSYRQLYLVALLKNSSYADIPMDYYTTRTTLSTATTSPVHFVRQNFTSILLYDYAMYDLAQVDFRITSGDASVPLASAGSQHQQWSAEVWGNQQATYGPLWMRMDGQPDIRSNIVSSDTIANIYLRNNYTTSSGLQTLFDIEVYGK